MNNWHNKVSFYVSETVGHCTREASRDSKLRLYKQVYDAFISQWENWDSLLRLWVETQKWTAAPERQPGVKRDLLAEGDRSVFPSASLQLGPGYYVFTVTESQRAKVHPSQRTWWRRSALGAPGSPSPNRCGPPVVGWSCGWFSSSSASAEGKVED